MVNPTMAAAAVVTADTTPEVLADILPTTTAVPEATVVPRLADTADTTRTPLQQVVTHHTAVRAHTSDHGRRLARLC